MAVDNIQLKFSSDFVGTLTSPTGTVPMGDQDGGLQPYHLLFGALGSCFISTFQSIAQKKRLTYDKIDVEVSGVKRTGEVRTLEHVKLDVVITNPSNEAGLTKSCELGTKFCSVFQTISKVAEMELQVRFE